MLLSNCSGLILGLRPANERRRNFVTTSLIGWAQLRINPVVDNDDQWLTIYGICYFYLSMPTSPCPWLTITHHLTSSPTRYHWTFNTWYWAVHRPLRNHVWLLRHPPTLLRNEQSIIWPNIELRGTWDKRPGLYNLTKTPKFGPPKEI